MKQFFGRYLSAELSNDKQLYNVAVLLGMAESVVVMLLSVAARINYRFILLMICAVVISYIYLSVGEKKDSFAGLPVMYIFVMYILFTPIMYLCSDLAVCVFPCYMITGIIYTTVLLHDTPMFLCLCLQLFVDLFFSYQAIVVRRVTEYSQMQTGAMPYIMTIVSVFITGAVCGIVFVYRNRMRQYEYDESTEIEERAKETSYTQNFFLVNVSHEIRTPLNAIQGTIELLLDMDTNDRVKENIFHMSNASMALLSITNDLLDFSMIDEDSITLEERPYHIGKIFNDIMNIFSVQYAESSVDLFVDINPSMTAALVGDGAKLEQIILSYITENVQHLSAGRIYLRVSEEKIDEQKLKLLVHLETKGSFEYLSDGQREDADKHAYEPVYQIRENICETVIKAMGGNIVVTHDEERRCFDFHIVQRYEDDKPLIEKNKYNSNRVLIYENEEFQREIFDKVLDDMEVEHIDASTDEMFYEECVKKEYTHILLAAERYEVMKEKLKNLLPPQSIVLINVGTNAYHNELVRAVISRPISCLNVDILFTGKKNYAVRNIGFSGEFECPEAKIMIVDDNIINLEVAVELLKKYTSRIITAISGKECLQTLQEEQVDLIFLDYMMPEMDGIETLKNIRALDIPEVEKIPVVALTANAVNGAREMFLNAGFDDYISKPTEIDKFEKVLREHLDPKKVIYISSKEENYGAQL